jgi:cell division protein FtsB
MKRVPLLAVSLVLVLSAGVGLLASSGWKEMDRSRQIEDEVKRLEREADRIRGENKTLTEQIAFFSSESFGEREAKEKLGMRHADESVLAIDIEPFPESDAIAGVSTSYVKDRESDDIQYYKKWLHLFGLISTGSGEDS